MNKEKYRRKNKEIEVRMRSYKEKFLNKQNLRLDKTETDFAKRLKELRSKNKFSQNDVSDGLLVEKSAYGYYENSYSLPDADTIARLSCIFQCTSDYLLGLSDSPNLNADIDLFDTNFSEKCNEELASIARSRIETNVFEMLITSSKFHKLLHYMDTYLTFSRRIDYQVKERYEENYKRAMYINPISNDYIDVEAYPSEKLRVTEVYLSLIEKTIMEMMKEISNEHSYTFRKKLNKIISEEIPKH